MANPFLNQSHLKDWENKSFLVMIKRNRKMTEQTSLHLRQVEYLMLPKRSRISLISWVHQEHLEKASVTQNEFLKGEKQSKTTILNKEKFKRSMDIVPQLKYFQMFLNLTNHNPGKKVKMIASLMQLKTKITTTMSKVARNDWLSVLNQNGSRCSTCGFSY